MSTLEWLEMLAVSALVGAAVPGIPWLIEIFMDWFLDLIKGER